ncbi:Probable exonuclease mut-7-like protein [Camponotus floridanus]|uniref:Probable exonuclease mut-7-like protein n=1 Tax=Camponotus floridanus TaxID=104421 RepID=E2AKG3_CAMFO|nr:exonuclease mut-7 homolog [Camponotus floridanus]EFN66105.1 Probable exonuclease mut-7-like protein [Camponotus floridanus]
MDLLFFSSIDDATKAWLDTLHRMWSLWKKCDGVSKTLTDYFETAPNPYLSTLRILVNTSDFDHMTNSKSLAFAVIEEFSNWMEDRKEGYKEFLVPDLKLAAFKLIKQKHMKQMLLIKKVSTIYEFVEHKDMFLQAIREMIRDKEYKEAAQYAAMLQLQSHFMNPEILLLPLILQNKLQVVDEFLVDCQDVQKALTTYLDNLIAPGKNVQTTLERFIYENDIPEVKISLTQVRPITKLVARLIKQYNLSPDVCPHLNTKRNEGALQFLIHKRYVDGSLNVASWREMVREAIGNDVKLQKELLLMLINVQDVQEGLYWAREYRIPKQEWPWLIVHAEEEEVEEEEEGAQGVSDGASTSRDENWEPIEDNINYHTLKLPRESINVVDNGRLFEEFLDNGLKNVTIVGIDLEWKPSFGTKQPELALIQIATEDNVYILDVTTLGNELPELWVELGLTLFGNKNIVKIGFGIAHDITVIRNSIPALSSIKNHGQGYLDLMILWRKLTEDYNFIFPYKGDPNFTSKSLSKLVELCFGQRLDKSDQFSNWELRPLRESQIIYAALDAYCLLEIYKVLADYSADMDIPFEDICAEIQHIPQTHKKPNTNKPIHKNSMYSNPTTCDKGSENYRANAGASPKYETTKYKPAVKQGYHNNKQKFAHVGILKTTNDRRHDNQKRYDNHDNQNRDRCARLGIIRVANDAKTDNQRRYENGDNHNQNRYTHVGMRGADGGRYENQKKYDKYDNYENYNRFDNHNHNRYDHPNRYGNQSRRDNHNRYDKQIGRREDVQGRFMDKIGKMNRSEPKVQRQHQEDLVAAHTWRVVCDSMLGGLSSKLRMCGVDCVHVLFDQGGDDSAKLAMRENRILLTRNKNYERFKQYLPLFEENCYRVMADTPDNQLREVLRYFGVIVTQNDIFSRCQICNCDEFVKVPKQLMDDLVQSFVKIIRKNNYRMLPNRTDSVGKARIDDDNSSDDFELVRNPNNYFTNSEHRTWRLSTNTIDVDTCTTRYQMRIQIDKVPLNVLKNVQVFYICEHCGKIYWDGSHLERALNGVIKDLIVKQ